MTRLVAFLAVRAAGTARAGERLAVWEIACVGLPPEAAEVLPRMIVAALRERAGGQWLELQVGDASAPSWLPANRCRHVCLGPDSVLRDAAASLGYDHWDGDPARFTGAAPDLGAREAGTSRLYGGVTSLCEL